MFEKISRWFKGYNIIRIEGLNLNRAIQKALDAGVCFFDVKRPSHRVFVASVDDKMLAKLIVTLEPMCYNVEIVKNSGFKATLKLAKFRAGLIIGLVAAIAFVGIYNTFLWRVEINGEAALSRMEIAKVLKDNGIYKGARKSSFDRRAAANSLNTALDQASLVTIEIKGTSAIVSIKSRIIRPDDNYNNSYGDEIVASNDCIITRISVLNGTALVKEGDIVKTGDVIIAAYEERYEGSQLLKDEVRADGIVWGEVSYTSTQFFYLESVEYYRTGKSKDFINVQMFGKKLGKDGLESPYPLYEKEVQNINAALMIPFRMQKTTYYEIASRLAILDKDEILPQYKSELLEQAHLKVPVSAQVLESNVVVTEYDNMIKIDAIIKTKLIISKRNLAV